MEDHKMKSILITLLTVTFFALSTKAVETKSNYFINTTGEITNCKKIQFKTNTIKVILENGEKLTIPKDQIKAIRSKNKYYEKFPVYVNNQKTDKEEFMQFVTTKAGLKLFKFTVELDKYPGLKAFNVRGNLTESYVVYKGDQYYVSITDKNYQTLFSFFGLPYTEE